MAKSQVKILEIKDTYSITQIETGIASWLDKGFELNKIVNVGTKVYAVFTKVTKAL